MFIFQILHKNQNSDIIQYHVYYAHYLVHDLYLRNVRSEKC